MEEKEDLKKELEKSEKLAQEYLAGWKRERADFINFKKEEAARLARVAEWEKENLVKKLLPLLDNMDFAVMPEDLKDHPWARGIENIKSQFLNFIKDIGLEEIESLGKQFDPYLHEAVETVEGESETPIVIEEAQKGYTINGKVIRPAKVKVKVKSS